MYFFKFRIVFNTNLHIYLFHVVNVQRQNNVRKRDSADS